MSLSFLRRSRGELIAVGPNGTGIRSAFRSFGQGALSRDVEHAPELLVVRLPRRGIHQLRPGTVDHIEYSGETQLTGVDRLTAGSHTHDRTDEVVGRNGHPQFLFQHVLAFGVNVL